MLLLSVAAMAAVSLLANANAEGGMFVMETGAEIRLEEPSGLRFTTKVDQSFIDALKESNPDKEITFGTEIVPEGKDVKPLDIPQTVWAEESTEETKVYKAVLTGIPETQYLTKITGKAYYAVDGVKTYASNPQTRSVAYVASAALADGNEDEALVNIVNKAVSEIESAKLNGKDSLVFATGAVDLSDFDTTLFAANGQDVTLEGLKYALYAGNEKVDTANVAAGEYRLNVLFGETVVAGVPAFVLPEKSYTEGGYYRYSDFSVLNSVYFDMIETNFPKKGGDEKGLLREWEEGVSYDVLTYTFLTDGWADFTYGGRVRFDTLLWGEHVGYEIWVTPKGGERVKIAEYADPLWEEVNVAEFTVAPGGTLEGTLIEIKRTDGYGLSGSFSFNHVVIEEYAAQAKVNGKQSVTMLPGEFNVNDYEFNLPNADAADCELSLTKFDGTPVELTDGKAVLDAGAYQLHFGLEGKEICNPFLVYVSEKQEENGKIVYDKKLGYDLYRFDYEINFNDPVENREGIEKVWNKNNPYWELTFLTDGWADFTNGGTVTFLSQIRADNENYDVWFITADGKSTHIGDTVNSNMWIWAEISFDVEPGGTLEGARLLFKSQRRDMTLSHLFREVLVEPNA